MQMRERQEIGCRDLFNNGRKTLGLKTVYGVLASHIIFQHIGRLDGKWITQEQSDFIAAWIDNVCVLCSPQQTNERTGQNAYSFPPTISLLLWSLR